MTLSILSPKNELENEICKSTNLLKLLDTIPNWCELIEIRGQRVLLNAQVIQKSGKPSALYQLELRSSANDNVQVKEVSPQHLPMHCPTRHVDEGGWLCIGLNAGLEINDKDTATAWWQKLKGYILLQQTAINCGVWPAGAELSHGAAGEIQERAENIAAQRGLSNEYQRTLADRGGIFRALRLVRRKQEKPMPLINGRAGCICNSRDKRDRIKLRRLCWSDNDECLVRLEHQRRKKEDDFVRALKEQGFRCCGTMEPCPFR